LMVSESDSLEGLDKAIARQPRKKGKEELRVIKAYMKLSSEEHNATSRLPYVTETDLLHELYGTEVTPSQRSNVRYFVKRNKLLLFSKRPVPRRVIEWVARCKEVLDRHSVEKPPVVK